MNRQLFVVVLAGGVVVSCSQNQSISTSCTDAASINWDTTSKSPITEAPEVITMHINDEPVSLHPTNYSSFLRSFLNQYLQRTLVTYDNDHQQLIPDLLDQMPEREGKTNRYAYYLKDKLYWDDGSPVTAKDIYFTFLVNSCPLVENFHAKTYLKALDEIIVDKLNDRKCTFLMQSPSLKNIGFATGFPILQAEKWDPENILRSFTIKEFKAASFNPDNYPALRRWANQFNDIRNGRDPELIRGLGAYTLSSWSEGNEIRMDRKKNNLAGPAHLVFKIIKDPAATQLSFSKQEVDASFLLSEEEFMQMSTNKLLNEKYHFACMDHRLYYFLSMNMRPAESGRPPFFSDKRVREALALATPTDTIIQLLGAGKRMNGPVYADNPEYDTSVKSLVYNPGRSKKLLEEAGWKDSDHDGILDKEGLRFSFTLLCSNNKNSYKDIALIVSEFYRKIGIEAKLQMVSSATLDKIGKSHQFDMILTGVSEDFLPQDFSELWHTQSWLNGGRNYSGFGNDTTDNLIDSIAWQSDMDMRIKFSRQLQSHIYKENPVIFLFKSKMYIAVRKQLCNVKIYNHRPYTYIDTWGIKMPN